MATLFVFLIACAALGAAAACWLKLRELRRDHEDLRKLLTDPVQYVGGGGGPPPVK